MAADDPIALTGTVRDAEGGISGATVRLSLQRSDGAPLWQVGTLTDSTGAFAFRASQLPPLAGSYPAVIGVEAKEHAAAQATAIVQVAPSGVVVSPSRVEIPLQMLSPWLGLLLLAPALFGMVFALLHVTRIGRSKPVWHLFAFSSAILWSIAVAVLTAAFALKGEAFLPLFWPDLVVSTGTVVFAYLGTVTYVAYALYQGQAGFYETASDEARRHTLITLGGRLLVSPYIAVVGQVILASTFPSLRSGAFAAFFGFFTGLWIEPVLEALNDIGSRFLSQTARQRLVETLGATTQPAGVAPTPTTTSLTTFKAEPALVEAVARGRELLLAKEGVVGVDVGYKVSASTAASPRQGLVAYVYKKAEPADEKDRIPETVLGVPVSVVELPREEPGVCSSLLPRLSWSKVHDDNQRRLGLRKKLGAPAAPSVLLVPSGGVALLQDPTLDLFHGKEQQLLFDAVGAFKAASLGEVHDFVSFVIDPELWSSVPDVAAGKVYAPGPYHIGVFSDITGTNYTAATQPGWYAERSAWGSKTLRACSVVARDPLSLWTHLHELGHYWSAYVTVGGSDPHALLAGNDGQLMFHWGDDFDAAKSCVDLDGCEWVDLGNNIFERRSIRSQNEGDAGYCDLDLYLMGLIDASAVKPLRLLRDRAPDGAGRYRARVEYSSINDVIAACGARIPSPDHSPKSFRLAFVVVSNDDARGKDLAKRVDEFRPRFEASFKRATRNLASIDTRA